jgi:hypothetical protein
MTLALFWLLAILQIAICTAVFASANSSIHQVLGMNLIGFSILTVGVAGLQSELRKARREAAKERKNALEDQQAKAAADLKQRSLIISSIDRQPRQTRSAEFGASRSTNGDPKAGLVLVQPHAGLAQFRSPSSERRWRLLTSSASGGDVSSQPFNPSTARFDRDKPRSRNKRR